jgi:serine-aspartate repeat-containing protein C/D/E
VGALTLVAVACTSETGGQGPGTGGSAADSSGTNEDGRTTEAPDDTSPPGTTSPDDGEDTMTVTTNPLPVCGDGVPEGAEECDDGNAVDGDGCDSDCTANLDTLEWQAIHAGDAMVAESGHGIAVDGAGNIVVGGFEVDVVGDPNAWVAKYDPAGTQLWMVTFDPSMGLDDRIYAVAIDPNDDILVTGDTDVMPAASDIWVAKLDPSGAELWSRTIDGPNAFDDGGRGIASDSLGNVVVTGFVRIDDADIDIYVGQLDPDGNTLWDEVVAGPETFDDRGQGVAVDLADDAVVVAGYISHGGFNRDVWLRKYDSDGDVLWTATWDDGNSSEDAGHSVAVRPDGTIAVVGMTPVIATNQDVFLGVWDGSGRLQWQRQFGGQAILDDGALAVASDADGNIVIVGLRGVTNTDSDMWIRKYDAIGNVAWSQVIAGEAGDRDQATAVATDAEGNILVTGEIRSVGNDGDVFVAKLGPG